MPLELDQQLSQLQLYCRHKVDHLLSGHYTSAFKGQGLEFDEVRPYTPGDDVRTIDWNVTARSGEVHIKRFIEERELNLMLVVDASASFAWSSQAPGRQQIAAQLCGLLGNAALRSNDRIGLLRFNETLETYVPASKGRPHLMRCLAKLLAPIEPGQGTDLNQALTFLNQQKMKKTLIVVISDFFDLDNSQTLQDNLAMLAQRHQVLAIAMDDQREQQLAEGGLIQLTDAERGGSVWIDLDHAPVHHAFTQRVHERQQQRQRFFADLGIDLLIHPLAQDPAESLLSFFQHRQSGTQGEEHG
ncbi:DUF58 domain-containing protein [Ferrimonas pelagia]|uniref:DUF58 domain-containing protein n=1 Tax=Ferrimonas pelagia TaxID=1177826 RepID=A0ABP9ELY4_9GAMM